MKKVLFLNEEKKMEVILMAFTFLYAPVCTTNHQVVFEKQEVVKQTSSKKNDFVKFKKVPTKWVKIPKKSN